MIHYLSQLQETTRRCWDKPAVCNWHGEQFSFADLAANIAKFGIFFEKIGLKKGDKVALCATNSARWAISLTVTGPSWCLSWQNLPRKA